MFGKTAWMLLFATAALSAAPSIAGTTAFSGTRQNVNFLNPPGTGRCAPSNTINITPNGPSSSGTSNLGSFVLTNSHCIPGPPTAANPIRPITDGLFTWNFSDGASIFGSYSGTADFNGGDPVGTESFLVAGGAGRFAGATGAFTSVGRLIFGQVDGRPVGIFNGAFQGTLTAAGIPEPVSWAMMIGGFAAIGLRSRGRVRARYV